MHRHHWTRWTTYLLSVVFSCSCLAQPAGVSPQSMEWVVAHLFGRVTPLPLLLVALQEQLTYCGLQDRPGTDHTAGWLFLSSEGLAQGVAQEQMLGLNLDSSSEELQFYWSEDLTTSHVVCTVSRLGAEQCLLQVKLSSHPDQVFPMELSAQPKLREYGWECGGLAVDGRLLQRMEGRWFGDDLLATDCMGCDAPAQRLEFGFGPRHYAIALPPAGVVHWKEGRWRQGDALGSPVLKLDSYDASRLNCICWDATGFYRSELSLPKLFSPGDSSHLANTIKLKGLRGQKRAQMLIGNQVLLCKQGDWMVKQGEQWKVLPTEQSQKQWLETGVSGEVVIIDALERKKGKAHVYGRVFSASHGETHKVEWLPSSGSSSPGGGFR